MAVPNLDMEAINSMGMLIKRDKCVDNKLLRGVFGKRSDLQFKMAHCTATLQ